MKRLIRIIGRRSKLVRQLYFKYTGRWLWGIIGFVRDSPVNPKHIPEENFDETMDWIDEHWEDIFRS